MVDWVWIVPGLVLMLMSESLGGLTVSRRESDARLTARRTTQPGRDISDREQDRTLSHYNCRTDLTFQLAPSGELRLLEKKYEIGKRLVHLIDQSRELEEVQRRIQTYNEDFFTTKNVLNVFLFSRELPFMSNKAITALKLDRNTFLVHSIYLLRLSLTKTFCQINSKIRLNERCSTIIEEYIESVPSLRSKTKPTIDNLGVRKLFVLTESSEMFRYQEVTDTESGGKDNYLGLKSPLYDRLQATSKQTKAVIAAFTAELTLIEMIAGESLASVQGCDNKSSLMLACVALDLQCSNLSIEEKTQIRQSCKKYDEYFTSRQPRDLLSYLFSDSSNSVNQVISNQRVLADNIDILFNNQKAVKSHAAALTQTFSTNMKLLNLQNSDLASNLLMVNALVELRSFQAQLRDNQISFMSRVDSILNIFLFSLLNFEQESAEILEALTTSPANCARTKTHGVLCGRPGANLLKGDTDGSLRISSQVKRWHIKQFTVMSCLPYKNRQIFNGSGLIFLRQKEEYVAGDQRIPQWCLLTAAPTDSCDLYLRDMQTDDVARVGDLFLLAGKFGAHVNSQETVKLTDNMNEPVIVSQTPLYILYSRFPLSNSTWRITREDVSAQTAPHSIQLRVNTKFNISQFEPELLAGPSSVQVEVALKEKFSSFLESLKKSKYTQAVTGLSSVLTLLFSGCLIYYCCKIKVVSQFFTRLCSCKNCCKKRNTVREALGAQMKTYRDFQAYRRHRRQNMKDQRLPDAPEAEEDEDAPW